MVQSLANVLIHLVFSTKGRVGLIRPEIRDDLWRYLAAICNAQGCPAHQAGGTDDHVHIALSLSRTTSVSKLAEQVKKSSSKWIKTKGKPYAAFSWQAGYGAFSIGQSQLGAVKRYIDAQEEHHKRRSFKDEFLQLLRKYSVEFDERYIWD